MGLVEIRLVEQEEASFSVYFLTLFSIYDRLIGSSYALNKADIYWVKE